MEIVKLKTGVLGVNTYLVSDNDTEAFVVDPGGDAQKIGQTAAEKGWNIQAVLLTHGHFDHIMAVKEVKEEYQIPVYACSHEKMMLKEPSVNMTDRMRKPCSICPDIFLEVVK